MKDEPQQSSPAAAPVQHQTGLPPKAPISHHHPKYSSNHTTPVKIPCSLASSVTPTDRLNFTSFDESLSNAPYAVLVSTGAFTPAHKNHLAMLGCAREYLQNDLKKFRIVGAYLSPSHQSYVDSKLKENVSILDDYLISNRFSQTNKQTRAFLSRIELKCANLPFHAPIS